MDGKITTDGTIALTQGELDYLDSLLSAGDRSGFYVAYYNMTGSEQAIEQSQISSFSEFVGGGACAANALLQAYFGPLNQYAGIWYLSQQVANSALDFIERSAAGSDPAFAHETGYVTDEEMLASAANAWSLNGQASQFPGNAIALCRDFAHDLIVVREPQFSTAAALDGAGLILKTMLQNYFGTQLETSDSRSYTQQFLANPQLFELFTQHLEDTGVLAGVLASMDGILLGKRGSDYTNQPGYSLRPTADGRLTVPIRDSDSHVVAGASAPGQASGLAPRVRASAPGQAWLIG